MRYLITGGCGFLGSNLAAEVLRQQEELYIIDNLHREGSTLNLQWLSSQGNFQSHQIDVGHYDHLSKIIQKVKPDVIFHLAGQVAMSTSIENPRKDFETNVLGSFNLLESVRNYSPDSIVTFSSTNKVYGDLEYLDYCESKTRYTPVGFETGFNESLKLDFHSPYGCSKGAAEQYMLDYARVFGLKTVVFRHSSIFGGRQFSTIDQGWVGWFVKQALKIKENSLKEPFTISGTGKQVRDILFTDDLVSCYFQAIKHIAKTEGQAFNIGGGINNSLSLLELFAFLENELDIQMAYQQLPWRKSDQKFFVADIQKAYKTFGWMPEVNKKEGILQMIQWVQASI